MNENTHLGFSYKFKSPFTCENWHSNLSFFLASPSNSPSFCALEKNENAFLPTTTLQGSTKLTMSTLELVKNGGASVLSTMFSIHSMSSLGFSFLRLCGFYICGCSISTLIFLLLVHTHTFCVVVVSLGIYLYCIHTHTLSLCVVGCSLHTHTHTHSLDVICPFIFMTHTFCVCVCVVGCFFFTHIHTQLCF